MIYRRVDWVMSLLGSVVGRSSAWRRLLGLVFESRGTCLWSYCRAVPPDSQSPLGLCRCETCWRTVGAEIVAEADLLEVRGREGSRVRYRY